MKYTFVLKENKQGGRELILPVPPQELKVAIGQNIETVNLVSAGEVDFVVGKKLWAVSFESFFPVFYDPSFCSTTDFLPPEENVKVITDWTERGEPVRLLITKLINDLFIITDFEYRLIGGTEGDIFYNISLRKYREVVVREKKPQGETNKSRTSTKERPKTYTVQKDDSLVTISIKFYGNDKMVDKIYDVNKKVIGPDKNKIKPGMVLILP